MARARTAAHGLTERREAFCRAYLENGGNGTAAHRTAFGGRYTEKQRNEEASKLLADPKVRQRVSELRATLESETIVEARKVVLALASIALADIRGCFDAKGRLLPVEKIDPAIRAAISTYEKDGDGNVKLRFWDKNAAADKLMRYLGLYERDNRQLTDNPYAEILRLVEGKSRGLPAEASRRARAGGQRDEL